jgi:hypothetical protein
MTDYTDQTTITDSSLLMDTETYGAYHGGDYGIRIGIVRDIINNVGDTDKKGVHYMVDVQLDGREIGMGCVLMTKFGGPHNFEEFTPRNWLKFPAQTLHPSSAGRHEYRAGDRVIVAALDGDTRQGVILGALRHPSRERLTPEGEIAYLSRFNGLDTEIRQDGTYKVTWRGLPINDKLLDVPPTGADIVGPQFDPLTSGSYYGFDSTGSYTVADGNGQMVKIVKSATGGTMALVSGDTRIDLATDSTTITSSSLSVASDSIKIKGGDEVFIDGGEISLNGKISIGFGPVELIDTLIKLIDEIGGITVTSPVGTCTPIMASPTWPKVVLLKTQLEQIKGGGPQLILPNAPVTDTDDFGDDLIV